MKPSRCQCVLLVLILVNLAILAYFINNTKSWPKVDQGMYLTTKSLIESVMDLGHLFPPQFNLIKKNCLENHRYV